MRIITLTTDFGLTDAYVGMIKGVVFGIAPAATVVDITHGISAHNVLAGALALESAVPFFPRDAIHVAVVDPGVGSSRRAIAVETDHGVFVGPDNGIFTLVIAPLAQYCAVELTNADYHLRPTSATFHGRDIFAPVAAHLAAGVPLQALGGPAGPITHLDIPSPTPRRDALELRIISVDHFGNLVTNLTAKEFETWVGDGEGVFTMGRTSIHGLSRCYAEVGSQEPLAYVGSGGRLELAVRDGSAACLLNARTGQTIVLTRGE